MPRSIDLESVISDDFETYQPLIDKTDENKPSTCSYICIYLIILFFILFDVVILIIAFYVFVYYIIQMIDITYIYAMLTGAICFVILVSELFVFGIVVGLVLLQNV